ncbi:protein of unknown function [Enterobacter cancerogenus]|nr:protein of unknown function [Enterobacter cancerogenus]
MRYCCRSCGICPVAKRFTSKEEVTENAPGIMRLIIELPWLNENCKSQAKYAYKNVVSPTNLFDGAHFLSGGYCTGLSEKVKSL